MPERGEDVFVVTRKDSSVMSIDRRVGLPPSAASSECHALLMAAKKSNKPR